MAQKTVITYTCDLSGEPADETVRFGLDKAVYEIDLAERLAKELYDALLPYIEVARRVPARKTPPRAPQGVGSTRADPDQTRAVRAWARATGHKVKDKGRIPKTVQDAFDAAH